MATISSRCAGGFAGEQGLHGADQERVAAKGFNIKTNVLERFQARGDLAGQHSADMQRQRVEQMLACDGGWAARRLQHKLL